MDHITHQCITRTATLTSQAGALQHDRPKVMRGVGRQCRGQGNVFMKLVRQTETPLLAVGSSMATLAQQAHQALEKATHLSASTREHWASDRSAAQAAHQQIRTPSRRLTQGKRLRHGTIVHAYDPTMAPMLTGKSHGPAQ